MEPRVIISALIFAASSLSASVYAADADKPVAPEAPAASKVIPHSHTAERTGVAASSTPAVTPAKGSVRKDKSRHFHPDTK
ncbi:hypothetical protein ACTHR6_16945 [Ralstonia holmesii]|uniref:hypothetical protein n=1 Tax=Ralstonia TaxID=48736 RepID=UPI000468AFC1|nr:MULTISPECIES: hypothetical protein [Ralstonia]CAJ0684095.1 hypothetical protein R11007_00240 [Ralstonia sp. LMG 32967]